MTYRKDALNGVVSHRIRAIGYSDVTKVEESNIVARQSIVTKFSLISFTNVSPHGFHSVDGSEMNAIPHSRPHQQALIAKLPVY